MGWLFSSFSMMSETTTFPVLMSLLPSSEDRKLRNSTQTSGQQTFTVAQGVVIYLTPPNPNQSENSNSRYQTNGRAPLSVFSQERKPSKAS